VDAGSLGAVGAGQEVVITHVRVTLLLVRLVTAVIIPVTDPVLGDASVVWTANVILLALL